MKKKNRILHINLFTKTVYIKRNFHRFLFTIFIYFYHENKYKNNKSFFAYSYNTLLPFFYEREQNRFKYINLNGI